MVLRTLRLLAAIWLVLSILIVITAILAGIPGSDDPMGVALCAAALGIAALPVLLATVYINRRRR